MNNVGSTRGRGARVAGRAHRRRLLRLGLATVGALAMQLAMAGGSFDVHNGTAAGGGGVASAGRFTVIWTIGEPAMGTTAAGGFRLTSGFPATIGNDEFQGAPSDGAIFKDGFEDSSGDTQ